jgi:hypothetical protein
MWTGRGSELLVPSPGPSAWLESPHGQEDGNEQFVPVGLHGGSVGVGRVDLLQIGPIGLTQAVKDATAGRYSLPALAHRGRRRSVLRGADGLVRFLGHQQEPLVSSILFERLQPGSTCGSLA